MARKKRKKPKRPRQRVRAAIEFHPKAIELGEKLKAVREAIGASVNEACIALACHSSYYKSIEEGKLLPSHELRQRFIRWAWEYNTWEKHPTIPAVVRKPRDHKPVLLRVYDKDFYERWRLAAQSCGFSMTAFAVVAIERLLEHEPTLVTIREAVSKVEDARWQMILEANPDILDILNGDPLQARYIHSTCEASPVHPETSLRGVADVLDVWLPEKNDGPSMPVALPPWLKKDYKK